MNRKNNLPNTNKMKSSNKISGKMKRKFLNKYIESQEICNNVLKIGQTCLSKRINFLLESNADKDRQLKEINDDRAQLKELIKWYDNGLIEEHHEKHELFQRAFEMPYNENINRLEFVKREFDKYKTNEQNKYINSQRLNNNITNWSQVNVSPISTNNNDALSPLQIKYRNNPLHDRFSVRRQNGSESPNTSFCSINNQSMNSRIYAWHKFEEKTVRNRICNACCEESSSGKKEVHRCKTCGIYIHESCRDTAKRKLCIPLVKIKLSSEGNIELKDLCLTQMEPMVPSIILCLMDHIHKFGMETEDLYRTQAKEKDVRELFDKLMQGKPKYLSRKDNIHTVTSCLRMVLRSLKYPLLSDNIMKKLIQGYLDQDLPATLQSCLDEMPVEFKETFVYLMIHLKAIADKNSRLKVEALAMIIYPSLISNEMATSNSETSILVIRQLISVDYKFYNKDPHVELFFQPVNAQLNASTNSFPIRP